MKRLAFLFLFLISFSSLTVGNAFSSRFTIGKEERACYVSDLSDQSLFDRDGEGEGTPAFSVFRHGGTVVMHDSDFSDELEERVKAKVPVEGELVYRSFAFQGRLPELIAPLEDDELCYVFSRIVASCTPAVPIIGRLESISFEKEGESLIAEADIYLDFTLVAKRYSMPWLPDGAHFSLIVPFSVKNSEISVISEKSSLKCKSFSLPETFLVFACNVAFGKKDYRKLFGEALKNVFLNAKIYS